MAVSPPYRIPRSIFSLALSIVCLPYGEDRWTGFYSPATVEGWGSKIRERSIRVVKELFMAGEQTRSTTNPHYLHLFKSTYLEESKSHLPVFALDESCVGFKLLDKGILQKRDGVDVVSRLMTDQLFLPDPGTNRRVLAFPADSQILYAPGTEAARTSAISEKDVVDLTKDDEDGVQFFTPSTEKLIEEISAASQTTVIDGASPTGCKRVLSFGVVQKATATVKIEPIDDDTLMQSMIGSSNSVESQVKKTKGKLKQN